MHDVIIVGARCGGASTAMLLARRGFKVLLLDRSSFPSDIPHGHVIHREGPRLLKQWGLLDRILASNCPPLTNHLTDFGDFPLAASDVAVDGFAYGYAPRRKVLDQILVEAAVGAGADFRERVLVEGLLTEDSTVCGVRARDTRSGAINEERAGIVIGADGRNSRIANWVGATAYESDPPATCWYFSYWTDMPCEGIEIYLRRDRIFLAVATNDALCNVAVAFPVEMFEQVRGNIETHFNEALALVPQLEERVRRARRVERFSGTADLPNFYRKPYGPGWALVGDAGCHKDPALALGISDAFRDAELLASAIVDSFAGKQSFAAAMSNYEACRNQAGMDVYKENLHFAQFKPVPEQVLRLRAAIRGDAEATRKFLMARDGMIPPENFFNPENIARLFANSKTPSPSG